MLPSVSAPEGSTKHMALKNIHEGVYVYIHTHIDMCVLIYLASDGDLATCAVFLQHPFFFIKPQMS